MCLYEQLTPERQEESVLCCQWGAPLDRISQKEGTSTPVLSRLVWGLSRADISSDAVVYELSSMISLTRRNGFSVLLCPRSSAPEKLSPHLAFPLSSAPITLCSEELAVQTGNNALKSCLKYTFPKFQDVFAGTGGAVAH